MCGGGVLFCIFMSPLCVLDLSVWICTVFSCCSVTVDAQRLRESLDFQEVDTAVASVQSIVPEPTGLGLAPNGRSTLLCLLGAIAASRFFYFEIIQTLLFF